MSGDSTSMLVRLPAVLHKQLKQLAVLSRIPLNQTCVEILQAGYAASKISAGKCEFAVNETPALAGLSSLVEEACREYGGRIDAVVLFGSAARGTMRESSDIDLLIVLAEGETVDRDCYSKWRWNRLGNREVAPLFVQLPRDAVRGVWLEIALDGIVIYDRALEASRYLAKLRALVAAGQYQRRMAYGQPYWIPSNLERREEQCKTSI
jgi:predicted nucleotidyltransferase